MSDIFGKYKVQRRGCFKVQGGGVFKIQVEGSIRYMLPTIFSNGALIGHSLMLIIRKKGVY